MHCSACKHENGPDDRFCAACGAPLAHQCGVCGAELKPDTKFCTKCGATTSQREGMDSHERTATRAVADYTPKHLADKILQSRSAIEGERKQVTVLFADVKGSMELAGQLDAEVWHQILDQFFSILTEGVHRFEGTVNQYTGDGIMALFGAPKTSTATHRDARADVPGGALHRDGASLEAWLRPAVRGSRGLRCALSPACLRLASPRSATIARNNRSQDQCL